MNERPILFSGPMVTAILDGQKTMTRRVVKPQPQTVGDVFDGPTHAITALEFYQSAKLKCPYGVPGTMLWVRETWCRKWDYSEDGFAYNETGNLDSSCVHFAADGYQVDSVDGDGFRRYNKNGYGASPWRPSIHMPRWASRITLEVVSVKVERLHEISEEDAKAEGVKTWWSGRKIEDGVCKGSAGFCAYEPPDGTGLEDCIKTKSYRDRFAELWDSINAKRGYSWESNPWVWAIEFRRVEAAG